MSTHDRTVAEQVRGGSEAAFEELFRAYGARLCAFAEGYVHAPEVAEDLVHDVFCDVWDRRVDFEPQGSVRAYLYGAVRNKALNWLKHQRVQRSWRAETERAAPPVAESAEQGLEHDELAGALGGALERLPERQRRVFVLARQQGLTYAEIAEVLGITTKSVENHMGRALKRLREQLASFFSVLL